MPAIMKMLRSIKYTEDASSDPRTDNIHILCDISIAMIEALSQQMQFKQGKAGSNKPPPEANLFPTKVPLPSSFYHPIAEQHAGTATIFVHESDCMEGRGPVLLLFRPFLLPSLLVFLPFLLFVFCRLCYAAKGLSACGSSWVVTQAAWLLSGVYCAKWVSCNTPDQCMALPHVVQYSTPPTTDCTLNFIYTPLG